MDTADISDRLRELSAEVGLITPIALGLGELSTISSGDVMGLSNMADRISSELSQLADEVHPQDEIEPDGDEPASDEDEGEDDDNVIPLSSFAKELREARLAAGFSSAQKFAEFISMEPAAYRHYERGSSSPPLDRLIEICQHLGVKPNDLLPEAISAAPLPSSEGAA